MFVLDESILLGKVATSFDMKGRENGALQDHLLGKKKSRNVSMSAFVVVQPEKYQ